MERPKDFYVQYDKGKQWIIAIIIGRIILGFLNMGITILREASWQMNIINWCIWAILLVKLYLGKRWVTVAITILHSISVVYAIKFIIILISVMLMPEVTGGYEVILTIIATVAIMSYFIISIITLVKNKNIKIFLEYQAYKIKLDKETEEE